MNAIEATLLPYKNAEPTVADDPEKRLFAILEMAERQYAEGKCHPASEVADRLFAIADRA